MERSEDLKQARDLHLIRDERDREVEAEAGLRAGRAVMLVSQLLAAACLMQRDPAWLALLSLNFVCGGRRRASFGLPRTGKSSIWPGAC